jgi:6,7-dimethyl-8-ribityllumazine synthase
MPPPLAIIVSRYNASITDALVQGAQEEYLHRGGQASALAVFDAPGTYELPTLAQAAAETGRYRGIVALGCVIRGETRHDRYISQAVANGLMQVSLQSGIPVAFGVLTVESAKQARARAGGEKGNKGREAMAAVLDTVAAVEAIRGGKPGTGASAKPDKAGAPA